MAQFWRDYVEANAGQDIEALKTSIHDQHDFAVRCQNILRDLGLSTDLEDPPELQQNDSDVDTLEDENEPETEYAPEDVVLDEDSYGDEDSEGETSTVEMDADMDMSELGAESEPEEAPQSAIDDLGRIRTTIDYKSFTDEFDEVVKAEELCDAEELLQLTRYARSATRTAQTHHSEVGEPFYNASYSRSRTGLGNSILRKDCSILRGLVRSVVDPVNPLAYKQEKEMPVPGHCCLDPNRQLGIHARSLHHDRGDVRGYIGTDARERCSVRVEILGIHDLCVARRSIARRVDQSRQTESSWAIERSASHHLQGCRRHVAASA